MLGVHHPLVKTIRKAVQRGARTPDGLAVAEGPNLVREALRSGVRIEAILATPRAAELLDAGLSVPDLSVQWIDESLMNQISAVENNQGVLALLDIGESPLSGALAGSAALTVALDGIQDPGNAGAIVRSAEAFGASGVVFLKGSVSPWNPKTLRASAGSLLRIPFALAGWDDFLSGVTARGLSLVSADPHAARRIDEISLSGPTAILIGNEGRGVPGDHAKSAIPVRIPTQGVESLNAALAAGILLYEARRQRS